MQLPLSQDVIIYFLTGILHLGIYNEAFPMHFNWVGLQLA